MPSLLFDTLHVNRSGAITAVSQGLQAVGIPAVPTFHVTEDVATLAEAGAACALHGHGACLRLGSIYGDPDFIATDRLLAQILAKVGVATANVDLVLDFSEIANRRVLSATVQPALDALHWAASRGPWRSVVLASGAFPPNITTFPRGVLQATPRLDAELYGLVITKAPAIEPDFGDYGIHNPALPPDTGGYRPLPNIRYAADLNWQILREERARPGNESFYTVAQGITSSGFWPGAAYSPGDHEIDLCSQEARGPGGPREWVQWGLAHHIAHVADRLAILGEP